MNKKLAKKIYKDKDRRDFEAYSEKSFKYKTTKRHNIVSKCGSTGKRIFMSPECANDFALTIDTKMRSYQCEYCGFYHLTSKVNLMSKATNKA